jgi:hypothetical protein
MSLPSTNPVAIGTVAVPDIAVVNPEINENNVTVGVVLDLKK